MGIGTAWGGRFTCNEDIQIGSNPIFSTNVVACLVPIVSWVPEFFQSGDTNISQGTSNGMLAQMVEHKVPKARGSRRASRERGRGFERLTSHKVVA